MIAMCRTCRLCLSLDNRHNGRKRAKPRSNVRDGLCWQCRVDFSRTNASKHTPPLPKEPTMYPPGSIGKIIIMAMREASDEQIHHPDDATIKLTREELIRCARRLPCRSPFVNSEEF